MEKVLKLESPQPRLLRYRTHYKIYWFLILALSGLVLSFWGLRWIKAGPNLFQDHFFELCFSIGFFVCAFCAYFFWLKNHLQRAVQVFPDHILIHNGKKKEQVYFSEIESVSTVCWSVFYFKLKNGYKHYFSSSLERVDYIWEGFYEARPDLMKKEDWDAFPIKLVQYDHHQKRREWFFRHRLIDVFNWVVLPMCFISAAWMFQSKEIVIYQQGLYFFRLFMYAILVMLVSTFIFSIIMKQFVFDKRIKIQLEDKPNDKIRDLEFEGIVLQRSKMLQMIMACFVFCLVVKSDLNLFSVTKIREDFANFSLKKGSTIFVDNRFNCLGCKYPVKEGDVVVFGRGHIGQIMASEGESIGQISRDGVGRIIASENFHTVPNGHVAVKIGTKNEVSMVRLSDLIGKIQN